VLAGQIWEALNGTEGLSQSRLRRLLSWKPTRISF